MRSKRTSTALDYRSDVASFSGTVCSIEWLEIDICMILQLLRRLDVAIDVGHPPTKWIANLLLFASASAPSSILKSCLMVPPRESMKWDGAD